MDESADHGEHTDANEGAIPRKKRALNKERATLVVFFLGLYAACLMGGAPIFFDAKSPPAIFMFLAGVAAAGLAIFIHARHITSGNEVVHLKKVAIFCVANGLFLGAALFTGPLSSTLKAPAAAKPFALASSTPIWARTFEHQRFNPPVYAYAVDRGDMVYAGKAGAAFAIDLLAHVAITNESSQPRRITEYGLAVAASPDGPWTQMCPAILRNSDLYWASNPKKAFKLSIALDKRLTESPLQPGATIDGWTGWICPQTAPQECLPAYLKFTLYDSRGETSEYVTSNVQREATPPPHDWAAAAVMRPTAAGRTFDRPPIEGYCDREGIPN